MSKLSLDNSVKFKRLIYASKIPKPYIRGLLDTLWNSAHTNGNPIIGTADDVEIASEWPGERGEWFALLRDGKWIEQVGDDQWRLWHYFDHCPDYVVKRIARSKGVEYKGLREVLMADFRNPPESAGKKRKPAEFCGRKRKPTQTRPDQTKQDQSSPQEGNAPTESVDVSSPEIPAAIDTPQFRDSWRRWLMHRAVKGDRVPNDSAAEMLRRLSEFGEQWACDRISTAIANDYKGLLFPEDKPGQPNAKPPPVRASTRDRMAEKMGCKT